MYCIGQLQDNDESLFFYGDNENVSTYIDVTHQPPFLDEMTNELLANTQLTSVCGNNLQCLFDYNQTGRFSIGSFTANFQRDTEFNEFVYGTY